MGLIKTLTMFSLVIYSPLKPTLVFFTQDIKATQKEKYRVQRKMSHIRT